MSLSRQRTPLMTRFLIPLVALGLLTGCTLDTGSRERAPANVTQASPPVIVQEPVRPVVNVVPAYEDFDVRFGDRGHYSRRHYEHRHYDHRGW